MHSTGKAEKKARPPAVDEADVLLPDQVVTVNGESVTVREFTLMQELRLAGKSGPILEALRKASFDGDEDITQQQLEQVFAEHEATFCELLAAACDKPVGWVYRVRGREGAALFMTFWSVNRHFFLDRMMALQINKVTGVVSRKPRSH